MGDLIFQNSNKSSLTLSETHVEQVLHISIVSSCVSSFKYIKYILAKLVKPCLAVYTVWLTTRSAVYKLSSNLPDTDYFNARTFLPAHYFAEATLLYSGLSDAQDDFD